MAGIRDASEMGPRLRLSVVICTKDRPEILNDTLKTVWRQSRLPDELVIVDDGHLDSELLAQDAETQGVAMVYINKSDSPGLARSRRAGIEHSTGDVIVFLDDDVLLHEDYLRAVADVFESDAEGRIGGCTGRLEDFHYRPMQMGLLRLFGMDDPSREGQILSNFVGVLVRRIERPVDVHWLPGCNMCYRREAIASIEIPAYLESYSQGEDRAISFEVGRGWRLVATPHAQLTHRRVASSRIDPRQRGFQEVYYNYLHFRRFMPRDIRHRAAYAWLCVGFMTINLLRFQWRRILGNLHGIRRILFGPHDVDIARENNPPGETLPAAPPAGTPPAQPRDPETGNK